MTGDGTTRSRFYWVQELSAGGMGKVDLVVRQEGAFRRLYAIKRLLPHLENEEDVRSMFLDEARIAGLLRHPNIVSVLDVGEDTYGPYLVMDYVEGMSVVELLRASGTRLPPSVALQIARQAALGLQAAHDATDEEGHPLELVHRDISPRNILVGYDGIVHVTDFGIAKALGRTTRTTTGVLKGKLGYLSPEQLQYEAVDRRADIFALGVVLYEMLAGRRLYSNKDGRGPQRILREPPPDVAEVCPEAPDELVALVFSMLAKNRDDRPATARDVADRLQLSLNELALEGDAVELADFIAANCADQIAASRANMTAAMDKLERNELPSWPADARDGASSAPFPRRRRAVVAGVVAALAVLGAGVWLGTTLAGSAPEAPAADGQPAADTASAGEAGGGSTADDEGSRGSASTGTQAERSAQAAPVSETEGQAGPATDADEAAADSRKAPDTARSERREAPRRPRHRRAADPRPRRRPAGERPPAESPSDTDDDESPSPSPWAFDGPKGEP